MVARAQTGFMARCERSLALLALSTEGRKQVPACRSNDEHDGAIRFWMVPGVCLS